MSIIEIALIGVGLAMDAFAVSICKGLAMRRMNYKKAIIIAAFFGGVSSFNAGIRLCFRNNICQ